MSSGNGTKNGRTGRPPVELDEEQVRKVGVLAEVLTQEQIADYLGIDPVTFRAIMKRDERVSHAYKTGKAQAKEKVASRLYTRALAGDVTCMIFFLKTQAGWRETNRMEVTGADGGPLEIEEVGPARSELARRIAGIATRN